MSMNELLSAYRTGVVRATRAHTVLDLGRSAFYELAAEREDFPRPIQLGRRAKGYLVEELIAWAARQPRG